MQTLALPDQLRTTLDVLVFTQIAQFEHGAHVGQLGLDALPLRCHIRNPFPGAFLDVLQRILQILRQCKGLQVLKDLRLVDVEKRGALRALRSLAALVAVGTSSTFFRVDVQFSPTVLAAQELGKRVDPRLALDGERIGRPPLAGFLGRNKEGI
ncbi:MAG: hypothetical protein M3477_09005, partial [Gemmatimonadota bacterium]|nr:hypothetical protein [Gemmatimonadota bacterium]